MERQLAISATGLKRGHPLDLENRKIVMILEYLSRRW